MRRARWLDWVLVLCSLTGLLAAPTAVSAGRPIGSQFVVSAATEQEVSPAVAYNSTRQEYLVVWYNDRPGNDDIRAQRVARNGALIGTPFYISAGVGADRRYPDVTYNPQDDQYLVVWEHYDNASMVPGYGICGRRVSGAGAVLDSSDIVIRSNGGTLATPATPVVAYASTSNRYLVVWAEAWHPSPVSWDIYGQVVAPSGALDGSQFSISHGTEEREAPDLAYNRHANRYLVVWQQKAGTLWDIHGQQVHGGGGLYQGDLTLTYYSVPCVAPAVAAIPTTPTSNKFMLVVEIEHSAGEWDILGKPVAEDGTPGAGFWISTASSVDESSPAVSGDESGQRYFVTWQHPVPATVINPIHYQSIDPTGALIDEGELSGINPEAPAVAGGPTGDFLTVWQDGGLLGTNMDIRGQLWGNRIYMPLVIRH